VNWPDYVVLAEALVAERREASKRSAVSRAYYGALNTCKGWLETNVTPVNRHRIHREVWGAFEGAGKEWARIAELGHELRLLRNRADYGDSFPDLDRQAIEAVGAAKQILALLPELELAD
jgi:hypothetical protein